MASAIMKPSTRVFILFVIVEAGLAGLWWYWLQALRTGELRPAKSLAETVGTVSTILGGAMGAIAGVMLLAIIVLRLRGR